MGKEADGFKLQHTSTTIVPYIVLRVSQQLFYKKCHFDISKIYFIILSHHFTISYLLDVLSFNFIHYNNIYYTLK